jgi:hypothetical protein
LRIGGDALMGRGGEICFVAFTGCSDVIGAIGHCIVEQTS